MDLKSRRILPIRPGDSFTQVRFNPYNSRYACASSWDGCLYIFDTENAILCCRYNLRGSLVNLDNETNTMGILSCDWASANIVLTGCTDNSIYATNVLSHTTYLIGRCLAPVRAVCSLQTMRSVCASGGWDGILYFWDCSEKFLKEAPIYIKHSNNTQSNDLLENPITPGILPNKYVIHTNLIQDSSLKHIASPMCLQREPLLGKVFCMSSKGNRILIGESGRFMQMFSIGIGKESNPLGLQKLMERETPLRHQIRSVQFISEETTDISSVVSEPTQKLFESYKATGDVSFALGSVEGRVAIDSLHGKNRFAFRCHRKVEIIPVEENTITKEVHSENENENKTNVKNINGKVLKQEVIISYPVNAMAILKGFLVTAGADNTICLWDIAQKIRVYCMNEESGVADIAVSEDQTKIAITLGYTWERGDQGVGISRNAIVIINTDEFFRSREHEATNTLLGNRIN